MLTSVCFCDAGWSDQQTEAGAHRAWTFGRRHHEGGNFSISQFIFSVVSFQQLYIFPSVNLLNFLRLVVSNIAPNTSWTISFEGIVLAFILYACLGTWWGSGRVLGLNLHLGNPCVVTFSRISHVIMIPWNPFILKFRSASIYIYSSRLSWLRHEQYIFYEQIIIIFLILFYNCMWIHETSVVDLRQVYISTDLTIENISTLTKPVI